MAKPASQKQREYRQRIARQVKCFQIFLDEIVISEKLMQAGFLDPRDADDHRKVQRALQCMVEAFQPVTSNDINSIFRPGS